MYDFNYHRPASVAEARSLFDGADDGVYLAGGHTLLPAMKQRLNAPSDLIDLAGVTELRAIGEESGSLVVGALSTHDSVATSDVVRRAIPALAALAGGIGDAQVRNRGTMGGSVANADPAADYPAGVLGLGATVRTDQREIAADDFFTGMFETALNPGELITSIAFPLVEAAAYVKFPNPASRYATVGAFVSRHGGNVRVAVTGASPSAFRMTAMEEALAADFTVAAIEGIRPDVHHMNEDMHASAQYRAHLVGVMVGRAVGKILDQ